MKINSLLAATLALVLVAGLGTPAFAQVQGSSSISSNTIYTPSHGSVDQSFTGPFAAGAFGGPTNPAGQGFIPTASNFAGVDVFVAPWPPSNPGGPETLTVNVRDTGVPGAGNLLGSSTVNIDTTGTSLAAPLLVHLDYSPFQIIPGNPHSIDFVITSDVNNVFMYSSGNPYPNGELWQNGNQQLTLDFGFVTYFDDSVVGGEQIPIQVTGLLLAAAQSPSVLLSALTIAALGIGAYVFTRNANNMRNIKVILRDYLDRF